MTREKVVLGIFVLSGVAGLTYEVVWARQLVLVFGNTTQAVSAILTGFFAGLAIGSVAGGRLADRVRSPLRLYGLLEIGLVAVVLATPILFRLIHEVYRSAYDSLKTAPGALALVRFGLALLALAPATILMGATLPSLGRYLARRPEALGRAFGRLYAANTIGAILGTFVAGLVLIELVGLTLTLVVGAACSATAGVVALALDRRARPLPAATRTAEEPRPIDGPAGCSPTDRSLQRVALLVAFVSGLTSLGYQVLWTRLLASGTGNSTYVFTLIIAFFLLGIAFGATAITGRPPRRDRVVASLAVVQASIGLLAVVGVVLIGGQLISPDFPTKVLLVVFPTTIAIGLSLPLASNLVGSTDERVGSDTGLLLGVNLAGTILATFAVPFVLIPRIGSPTAVVLLAAVNITLGIFLAAPAIAKRLQAPDALADRRRRLTPMAASLGAAAIAVPLVAGGAVADPAVTFVERNGTLWDSAEDEIASVQAGRLKDRPQLWVVGSSMTALTVDARLMAVLPAMFRPTAGSLLVIAFGMGSSYRSGLILGLEVEGVELVPSVPKMFGHYFADADTVLADPHGRLLIADGRNHVELTTRRYDLIIVDPPPPIKSSGTVVLYSREFYEASAARLSDGGVMMLWMPYDQSVDEFRAHVRTFHAVFPNVTIAFGPGGAGVFMFGSTGPLHLEEAAIREVLRRPGVLEDVSSAFDSPATTEEGWLDLIASLVWISGSDIDRFGGDGPLITDDRPLTEYFLLRGLFGPSSPPMLRQTLLRVLPGTGA